MVHFTWDQCRDHRPPHRSQFPPGFLAAWRHLVPPIALRLQGAVLAVVVVLVVEEEEAR